MASIPPALIVDPPRVEQLVDRSTGTAYALRNWTEFLRWARDHDALFRDVDECARQLGYSEQDRVRVGLHALLIDRDGQRRREELLAQSRGHTIGFTHVT